MGPLAAAMRLSAVENLLLLRLVDAAADRISALADTVTTTYWTARRALGELERCGFARKEREQRPGRGRPHEVWHATQLGRDVGKDLPRWTSDGRTIFLQPFTRSSSFSDLKMKNNLYEDCKKITPTSTAMTLPKPGEMLPKVWPRSYADDVPYMTPGTPEAARVARCVSAYLAAAREKGLPVPPLKLQTGSRAYVGVAAGAAARVEALVSPELWARFQIQFHGRYGPFAAKGTPPPVQLVFAPTAVRKRAGWCLSQAAQLLPNKPIRAPLAEREAWHRKQEAYHRSLGHDNPLTSPEFPEWYREKRVAEGATIRYPAAWGGRRIPQPAVQAPAR